MKLLLLSIMLFAQGALAESYIVRTDDSKQVSTLSTLKGTRLQYFNGIVTELTAQQADKLRQQGFEVEVNGRMHILGYPSKQKMTVQEVPNAPTNIPWGIDAIQAPKAQKLKNGAGQGITVCIVDTGISAEHPELAGQVVGGVGIAKSTIKDKPEWYDDQGHGTHVSGTVAGLGKVVLGVAPEAKLYAVKVLDKYGSGSYADVAEGIKACIGKAQVINMSLGGPSDSKIVHDAVIEAKKAGLQIACAAGNEGGAVGYPAKYDECTTVSALTPDNKIASFSSRGTEVDFIAPGVNVKSSTLNGGYAEWDGTSMATPHVAGTMAIELSRKKKKLKFTDIKLKQTEQGNGRIDAYKTARGLLSLW